MRENSVSATLVELTLSECEHALGVSGFPSIVRRAATLPFRPAARRLGAELERFDNDVAAGDLQDAAARVLRRLGVDLHVEGAVPPEGPLLILSNHPGAYDALSLFACIARSDLSILAAERDFLRAMPALQARLLSFPEQEILSASDRHKRGLGLRRALRHLDTGGALLQFGAGRIEPDPDFPSGAQGLLPWQAGSGALATFAQRKGGHVVVAVVSGVHSARAKRARIVRAAEARGISTLAPLLQLSIPFYAEVRARVWLSKPLAQLPADPEVATRQIEAVARARIVKAVA